VQNQFALRLDKFGRINFDLKGIKYSNSPQRAVVEVTYKDSNGDIQNVTRAYPFLASAWVLGLKPKSWFMSNDSFDFEAALLDVNKKPVAHQEVSFSLYQRETYSTRKNL